MGQSDFRIIILTHGDRVTDKYSTEHLNLEKLRSVTDKRNNIKVKVTMPRFIFPDYSHNQVFNPHHQIKLKLSDILENVALCTDSGKFWLILAQHERYIEQLLDYDNWEITIEPDLYEEHFSIIKPTRLSMYMCWDDVLYVFDDGRLFVARSTIAIEAFRKARKI